MAEGYTRAKAGNIGVCVGTSGPAGTDMITGLYSASRRLDPDPVHHRPGAGRQAAQGGLPGRRHRRRSPGPLTKMAVTVLEPAQVPGAFQQAFHLMRSGPARPGADRPAVRRADGRDRVRPRHLRAAAGRTSRPPTRAQVGQGAGHAGRGRAAADRGRRRHHQRRRRRPAGRARRADRRAGHPDPDGLGHDPGRPPADGRHGRPADLPPVRQRHHARRPTSCSASATGGPTGTPAGWTSTARAARSCTSTSSRPRSAGCSRRTTASCPTPAPPWSCFVAVARERKAAGRLPDRSAWAQECQERKRTMQRRTHFDNVPIKPQRVYEEMNKAFGPDTRYVSTIGLSQIAGRAVPARLQAAALDQRRPGRAAGLDPAGRPRGLRRRPGRHRGRAVRRLRLPVHDRGAGGRRAVQPAVHPRAGEQRLPGPDPAVAARLRHGLLRAAVLRQHQRAARLERATASTTSRWPRAWAARRFGCSSPRRSCPRWRQAKKMLVEHRVPVVVEVILERVTNISMGLEIDNVVEFEELARTGRRTRRPPSSPCSTEPGGRRRPARAAADPRRSLTMAHTDPRPAGPDFTGLPDLASRALGGGVVCANDELFAERENLIKPERPGIRPHTFGHKGQVYDGWETRRRREPGHDWAIVRLGGARRGARRRRRHRLVQGQLPAARLGRGRRGRGLPVAGRARRRPTGCAMRAAQRPSRATPATRSRSTGDDARWTHVRLTHLSRRRRGPAAGARRGRCPTRGCSTAGRRPGRAGERRPGRRLLQHVLLLADQPARARPGPASWARAGRPPAAATTATTGWRSGSPAPGVVRLAELDTTLLPRQRARAGRRSTGERGGGDEVELLPRTRLQPDTRHRFRAGAAGRSPHVRLDIYPDGGMARLRLFGDLDRAGRDELVLRWFNLLPPAHAAEVLTAERGPRGRQETVAARPLGSGRTACRTGSAPASACDRGPHCSAMRMISSAMWNST